jgi:quercetin dioxygenase-like cupin family protein
MAGDPAVEYFRLEAEPGTSPLDGVRMRAVFGESSMINLIEIAPGAVVPRHEHPHEQLGVVFRGELILEVQGVERRLGPLDAYTLRGGVEHGARGGAEGCLVVDVFTPVREDYRAAAAPPIP